MLLKAFKNNVYNTPLIETVYFIVQHPLVSI